MVLLIECSEESGSPDLPAYLTSQAARIGSPDLVLCLGLGLGVLFLWALDGSGRRRLVLGLGPDVAVVAPGLAAVATAGVSARGRAALLVRVFDTTHANDESAHRMGVATQDLLRQAEALREEMGRFRL